MIVHSNKLNIDIQRMFSIHFFQLFTSKKKSTYAGRQVCPEISGENNYHTRK